MKRRERKCPVFKFPVVDLDWCGLRRCMCYIEEFPSINYYFSSVFIPDFLLVILLCDAFLVGD